MPDPIGNEAVNGVIIAEFIDEKTEDLADIRDTYKELAADDEYNETVKGMHDTEKN